MSWLSRLFGGEKPAPEPPPPPPHTVVIPDDLAIELTGTGVDLTAAVIGSLREHREAQRKAAEALARGERIPFWLQRDKGDLDIEDELRERVTQRRAEAEAVQTGTPGAAATPAPEAPAAAATPAPGTDPH